MPAMHLIDRRREHEEPHVRTTEQQILDALLRIEELLQPRSVTDRGNYEDRVTPEEPKVAPKRGRK